MSPIGRDIIPQYTVAGRCPHGLHAVILIDEFGTVHPQPCQHNSTRVQVPSRWTLWRETRKARKALRRRPPWLSS